MLRKRVMTAVLIRSANMPPLTGDGTQKRCKKAILRVIVMPAISARAPTPAVCIMSSSICAIRFF